MSFTSNPIGNYSNQIRIVNQNSTPSVTTPIGAEGIPHKDQWPGEVASGRTDFSKAAVQLYQNQKAWEVASQRGLDLVASNFSKRYLHQQLSLKLKELLANLGTHRSNNFIGGLLQHHTMTSTKYMGKWIEAKNN